MISAESHYGNRLKGGRGELAVPLCFTQDEEDWKT